MGSKGTGVLVRSVQIDAAGVTLEGDLAVPAGARGIVLFAHGSGSSRHSPRNRRVARVLHEAGLATLLFDLLTEREEQLDAVTAELRFDVPLLAERVEGATEWVRAQPGLSDLPVGYFGASTGAAAALVAAAALPDAAGAVVSRGGRPDLASERLSMVRAPTLLIVGADDEEVIELNRAAFDLLTCERDLVLVEGATHLFEEPGALDEVARLAAGWFARHLGAGLPAGAGVHSRGAAGAGTQDVPRPR